MKLAALIQKGLSYLQPYAHHAAPPGLCCISLTATGIAAAYVIRSASQALILQCCQFIPCTAENLWQKLSAWVDEQQLRNVSCSWMLQNNDYKLINAVAPSVEPKELRSALRWQIKEWIDFPAAEAALDFFSDPAATQSTNTKNLKIVVAHQPFLQRTAHLIHASGLNLTTIDIPEFALRNITALFPDDQEGLAIAWLKDTTCELVITRQKSYYWNRRFQLTTANMSEQLVAELERSFNYYGTQLQQNIPAKMLTNLQDSALTAQLSQRLKISVEKLDFSLPSLSGQEITPELQQQCLAVIGGALREESASASGN